VAGAEEGLLEEDADERLKLGWRKRKGDERRFHEARNGDDLMVQFECDFCVFLKLYLRRPVDSSPSDQLAMACIRRIILDAFWSRARSTVEDQARKVRHLVQLAQQVGMPNPGFENPGPLPAGDHCGYRVAFLSVLDSLQPGRYSEKHKQWDTVRRVRTVYTNQARSAGTANSSHVGIGDQDGKEFRRVVNDPCTSLWFTRWAEGCKRRMGQDWRPNQAVDPELLKIMLKRIEAMVRGSEELEEIMRWTLAGGYFVMCYVNALRGNEGLLLDAAALLEMEFEDERYVVFPLLGKVKGEHHARQHKLILVKVTDSGIDVGAWVHRLVSMTRCRGKEHGPVIVDQEGTQATSSYMNETMHEVLLSVLDTHPDLFPHSLRSEEGILERYDVARSFRRGSQSRAMDKRVSETDRYLVNRWKKKEGAGGKNPNHPIDHHYCDVRQATASFLRYTQAM
jgi:hypothetical protein